VRFGHGQRSSHPVRQAADLCNDAPVAVGVGRRAPLCLTNALMYCVGECPCMHLLTLLSYVFESLVYACVVRFAFTFRSGCQSMPRGASGSRREAWPSSKADFGDMTGKQRKGQTVQRGKWRTSSKEIITAYREKMQNIATKH